MKQSFRNQKLGKIVSRTIKNLPHSRPQLPKAPAGRPGAKPKPGRGVPSK